MCYDAFMGKILEQALERAKSLPDARQDEIGEMILEVIEQDQSSLQLSSDQQEEVRRRLAYPEQPASEQETEAFFDKFA
jgi:hypothetical protein